MIDEEENDDNEEDEIVETARSSESGDPSETSVSNDIELYKLSKVCEKGCNVKSDFYLPFPPEIFSELYPTDRFDEMIATLLRSSQEPALPCRLTSLHISVTCLSR